MPSSLQQLAPVGRFGRYEILGRLASGGMAEIFLAREATAAGAYRHLVVKRLLPHVVEDDQIAEMFLDEARLAIQLSHPNICHIYDLGEIDGSFFIAMEWVDGSPLGRLIRRARAHGGVPPEVAVRVISQTGGALHYAHRARGTDGLPLRIVHRDVSPQNIMIRYDGTVKLLDFGVAKAASHRIRTDAGVIKGKLSYMAPEQVRGRELDGRADVFSLGICLYEALTGRGLYHHKVQIDALKAIANDPVPSIRDVDPSLPAELDALVQRALAREPQDRCGTAGEMQAALDGWLASQGRVVGEERISDLMGLVFAEEIERGPAVESSPFGQSLHREPVPAVAEPSPPPEGTTTRRERRGRAVLLPFLVAAVTLVLGSIAGVALVLWLAASGTPEPEETGAGGVAVADPPPGEPGPPEGSGASPGEGVEGTGQTPAPDPPGRLTVQSTPSGAAVFVDGAEEPAGTTPLELTELEAGTHRVEVRRAGHRTWRSEVEVAGGEQARLSAQLARREATEAPPLEEADGAPGRLSINTRPWSKVYVGGRLLGTTPIGGATVPSGAVRLRLVDRDGDTHDRTVRVPPGDESSAFFDLTE